MAGVTRRASLAVLWLALTPLGAAAWMQELFVEEETLLLSGPGDEWRAVRVLRDNKHVWRHRARRERLVRNEWVKVVTRDGQKGWVPGSALSIFCARP